MAAMPDFEQPAAHAVPSFGEELRKERELRGISLKEIADATKISKRFLEAIERNDLAALPAPVFTRGFVREYARYLGLNAEEMVGRYGEYLRHHEAATQAEEAAKIDSWNARSTGKIRAVAKPDVPLESSNRGSIIAFIVSVVVVAGLLIYFMTRGNRGEAPRSADTSTATATASAAVSTSTQTATTTATATAPPTEGLLVQLKLIENSWITLQVDGETVINDELRVGDEKSFEAKDSVVFKTIGNAGGVEITLNGTRVPPLGESGDVVRNKKFDRSSLDELTQDRTE
jgi:cytoskeletal protein RodZ